MEKKNKNIIPDLSGANLSGSDLKWANLSMVDLKEANLNRADLTGTNLRWASLIMSNLVGADLTGANLMDADLNGSDLTEANLRTPHVSADQLVEAKTLYKTKLSPTTETELREKHPERYKELIKEPVY